MLPKSIDSAIYPHILFCKMIQHWKTIPSVTNLNENGTKYIYKHEAICNSKINHDHYCFP